eukprot:7428238-Pyramimonas_sp.AAC.1
MSVYLKSGTGLCELNLRLLKKIGQALQHEHLFLAGGDWNLAPSLIESVGLPRRLEAILFVPKEHTCVSPSSLTALDFFLASNSFSRAVE